MPKRRPDMPDKQPDNMSKGAEPGFIQQQFAFASHIRDPQHCPAPADVEDRRMAIYRELFYNNIEGFLESGFPVLRRLLDDDTWQTMARDFFVRHRCHSPLFLDIGREFLDYLNEERGERDGDLPFMRELAHYEWIELALSIAETEESVPVDSDGDLLEGIPVASSLAWPLTYSYPVHRIGPDFQPREPDAQPTYLLAHRDADDEVQFMELNPVSARLFSMLQDQGNRNGTVLLRQIAEELQHPDTALVIEGGHAILEQWRHMGIVRGTRRKN